MKKASYPHSTSRHNDFNRPPPHSAGGSRRPVQYCPHQRKPQLHPHTARIDRPPEPYFTVELHLGRRPLRRDDVEALIAECKHKAEMFTFYPVDDVAAALRYRNWEHARHTVVWFWELRLAEKHDFTPALDSNAVVRVDMDGDIRRVFARHVRGLMEGREVKRWVEERERLSREIARISRSLRNPLPIATHCQFMDTKKGLVDEKNIVERRLKEFESAMGCILKYLEDGNDVEGVHMDMDVFKFDGVFDWKRIHCLIKRECRRLDDGLPIYAYRRDILQEIFSNQITVLIGETGSGKSTQLIQFLADSGIGADESIICTQPRKIAAKSVAQRVHEESSECYEGHSIKYCSTFSSLHGFDSMITFMTDHCLLLHYMSDKNLSGVSCIIIDEAHERSLNTDLLLTLLKDLLYRRDEMRLIIMSATADAKQLSDYFYQCGIFRVLGRSFPVEVKYVPSDHAVHFASAAVALYVSDVVRMATEIHKKEKEGTILAFLTSQIEVEWACENFQAPSAVTLPLHGKLSSDEQFRVFQNYPGKRKVIFSTNLAETSLTIPGVKYVIDSGLVKDSRFDPSSGMNVLKVCWISQSSADQRAGRAGRTEPGVCYRLYSEADYQSMDLNQEPEIRRVHLGVAVLRILALGVKNVLDFEFVDAPSPSSIDLAIRNLIQLGAIKVNNNAHDLTSEGRCLVRMGIEPRLGKLILGCFKYGLGREGIVLAAVMANASSIFCRVGSIFDKQRSDCLKVQFCHCDGDLFTLLSVYKEWEALPREMKNKWCWENSINAKSMRRCQDTILELETCLGREHSVVTPSYWRWDPYMPSSHDRNLKKVILSSLAENVAMYSGCNQLGYEVAQTGQHVQLHPSCSLLVFAQKPSWVVFGELLCISNQYLVCVSAFDFQSLYNLCPAPLFDITKMAERKLQMQTLSGLGCILLKRLCGKANSNLLSLASRTRKACMDERICIEVNVDQNEINLYATSNDMNTALGLINGAIEYERKWLRTECVDKCLYHGSAFSPPIALFGSGAEIKHLELEKRALSVDVCHPNINAIDDKELLMFIEKKTSGCICAVHKFAGNMKDEDKEKWGRITFMSPDVVKRAAELDGQDFCGSSLKIFPSPLGGDKTFSFPAVKAKISWPRRLSRGFAIVKCDIKDVNYILGDFYNLAIGGRYVRCEVGKKSSDCVVINGIDKELSEAEILDVLRTATSRRILDFFLVRGNAVENPSCSALEEALLKEILPFLPKRNPHISSCRVQVFAPEPKDASMRAVITFDGRLHLEAAKALEQIEGKVLTGCLSWQKIKCQQLFHSSLIFPPPVYRVIKEQLDEVLASFRNLKGLECNLDRTVNGSHRVKITANATRTVAEVRRPLEELLRGKTIEHDCLTPAVLHLMMSKDGFSLKSSLQQETGTYIFFDRNNLNLRVFGSPNRVALAQEKVIQSLLSLHDEKQLEIPLRGRDLPPDLMKQMIKNFGPDLRGLMRRVPGVNVTLNIRPHTIMIHGSKELKPKVEEIIFELAHSSRHLVERFDDGPSCPICLCEVEDGYRLEGCGHLFCRFCLVEQFESAIKNQGTFPICCTHRDCGDSILLSDFRSLLFGDKLEDLFRASLRAFVAASGGTYRFCPFPDCPSIYRVADSGTAGQPFVCGACYSETCTRCHLEYHPYLSCERYKEFKEDPDSSLKEWCRGKEQVKSCPACGFVIEKVDGCNHVECKCGKHVCWVCLEFFTGSDECYNHLRSIHMAII